MDATTTTTTTDYAPGAIVTEPHVMNAWIARNGNIHFVPEYGHSLTAELMGYPSDWTINQSGVDAMERAGFVHVSVDGDFVCMNDMRHPTDEQYDALMLMRGFAAQHGSRRARSLVENIDMLLSRDW